MLNYAANLGPLNDTGNILGHWGPPQDAGSRTGASSPPSEPTANKSPVVKIVHPIPIQSERPQDRSPRKRDRRTAGLLLNPGGSPEMPQGMREPEFKGEIHPPPTKMSRLGMYETYQPWVLQTYGDSAKTKTITRNKYQRILQILRGDYVDNETSKFKLWVKGRGFRIGPPPGFVGNGGGGVEDALKDPLKEPLGITQLSSTGTPASIDYNPDKDPFPDIYVQTGTIKDQEGHDRICFKKVAVVEDFFDIIYNLHVCKEGKDQKHMGQKRTYRAVSERYAFVPREAVTKFLVLCTECPRRSVGVHVGVGVPVGVTTLPGGPQLAPPIAPPISSSMQVQTQTTVGSKTSDDRLGDKPRFLPMLPQHQQPPSQHQHHHHHQHHHQHQQPQPVAKPQPLLKHQHQQTSLPHPIHIQPMKIQPKTKGTETQTQYSQQQQQQQQQTPHQQKQLHPIQHQQQQQSNSIQQQQAQQSEQQRQEQLQLQKQQQQEQKEREEAFDKKVSAVSHDLEYRLPFTNIYLKHCHHHNNNNNNNNSLNNNNNAFGDSICNRVNGDGDDIHNSNSADISSICDKNNGIFHNSPIDIINNNNIIKYNNNFTQTPIKDGPNNLPESDGSEDELKNADVERKPESRGTEWCPYQPLGLTRTTDTTRRSPCASPSGSERAATATPLDTASNAEDTSSNGNKDDEDDDADDDNDDDKIDAQYDPERLKAFNMFVRLFVDENLDRIVPISKQPKEKIQAIIDACARQFPEFAERTRKRIRTYLKSCRRNKRTRDSNGWETPSRPTPPHLTSIQAEQILANACENEAQNAKRMRLGLEPIAQPNPLNPQPHAQMGSDKPLALVDTVVKTESNAPHVSALAKALERPLSESKVMNGSSMFQASFQQSFQKVSSLTGSTVHSQPGLAPMLATTSASVISNGPTDLSVKGSSKPTRPTLNAVEVAAVRQLITGYRESAAFLLRSADELENLLIHQQSP